MNDISITNLDDNISIYRGLLPNHSRMVDVFRQSEGNSETTFLFKDWKPWATFGTYVLKIGEDMGDFETIKSDPVFVEESALLQEIKDAFYNATKDYMEKRGLSIGEDWVVMGPSISKYSPDKEVANGNKDLELEMMYHTDYVTLEGDWPGNKFILTCTMYLNDDYDGGDISFRLPNREIVNYKPTAGDVLVFPSGHPDLLSENGRYLHGVKLVKNSEKYMIRCFYQKPFSGNPEWLENEKKYGSDVWMKMEKERVQKESQEMNRRYMEELTNDNR